MSRLDKYKLRRQVRRVYFFSLLVFLSLILIGLGVVDYTFNGLMKNDNSIEIFNIATNDQIVEIDFMNRRTEINITYLERDFQRIVDKVKDYIKK